MTISTILTDFLEQYDLSLDDIRWYCSRDMAMRMLSYRDNPGDLTRWIWSGAVEAELYKIEEQFLSKLEEDFIERRIDESQLHSLFSEIQMHKRDHSRRNSSK